MEHLGQWFSQLDMDEQLFLPLVPLRVELRELERGRVVVQVWPLELHTVVALL